MTIKNINTVNPIQLTIDIHKTAVWILIISVIAEILFIILDYYLNYSSTTRISALEHMFNITREDSLASWFSCTQTLMLGLTLGFIWLCKKNHPDSKKEARSWLILTIFFLYMAFDDGVQIHERLGSTLKEIMTGNTLDFFPSYSWQVVFLPFFIGFGIFTYYFLWKQVIEQNSRMFLLLSISCFGIAVCLDFIEGLDQNHPWNLYSYILQSIDLTNIDTQSLTIDEFKLTAYEILKHFSKSIEESLEMFGHTIIWYVVLRHIPISTPAINIVFYKA